MKTFSKGKINKFIGTIKQTSQIMQNIHDKLEQIIDNLLLIKNNADKISSIEKDILLQNLREAYLLLLRQPVSEEVQIVGNQDDKIADKPEEAVEEEKQPEEAEIRDEEEVEEENEEMDTDILEFVKEVPKADPEEKNLNKAERDLFSEAKIEKIEEPEPIAEPEAERSEDSDLTEETIEPEPIPEPVVVTEPASVSEPEVTPEPEKVAEAELPEISEAVPEPEPEKIAKAEVPEISEISDPEPEPAPKPEKSPETKAETVKKFAQILELEPQSQPEPEKPQQRSLNDLFNEQKQDLGDKFQQTKITDLTKAMSINDKFLFIRELFKNKSEEFSRAIQTLNKCENIEEAFDIMEGLKKQYFWDSTSSAYLALCDLVRRKF